MQWEEKHKKARALSKELYGSCEPSAEDVQTLINRLKRERYDFVVMLVEMSDWTGFEPRSLMAFLDIQDFDLPKANIARLELLKHSKDILLGNGCHKRLVDAFTDHRVGGGFITELMDAAQGLNKLRIREITFRILASIQ